MTLCAHHREQCPDCYAVSLSQSKSLLASEAEATRIHDECMAESRAKHAAVARAEKAEAEVERLRAAIVTCSGSCHRALTGGTS